MSREQTEVDRIAQLLLDTWIKVDPKSNVALHPASYVATFADMARAVLEDLASKPADAGTASRYLVTPLVFGDTFFVIHSSGSYSFFADEEEARAYAYQLDRWHYKYGDEAVAKHGPRLKKEHDEWMQAMQEAHVRYVIGSLQSTKGKGGKKG